MPKTLLAMSGATLSPPKWDDAVLLLIDFQREYTEGALPLYGFACAIDEACVLLASARKAGAPIIHIVHHGRPGGALFDPEGPLSEIVSDLSPTDGEVVIAKGLPNAFAGTDLDNALKATGRTQIVIAGFMTHMCVSATARSALDHGYFSTVVASACATRDLPDPVTGGTVKAADLHKAALTGLSDRFALIVKDAATFKPE